MGKKDLIFRLWATGYPKNSVSHEQLSSDFLLGRAEELPQAKALISKSVRWRGGDAGLFKVLRYSQVRRIVKYCRRMSRECMCST
jgi:hypothetical protein